jgi:hypothetical protein
MYPRSCETHQQYQCPRVPLNHPLKPPGERSLPGSDRSQSSGWPKMGGGRSSELALPSREHTVRRWPLSRLPSSRAPVAPSGGDGALQYPDLAPPCATLGLMGRRPSPAAGDLMSDLWRCVRCRSTRVDSSFVFFTILLRCVAAPDCHKLSAATLCPDVAVHLSALHLSPSLALAQNIDELQLQLDRHAREVRTRSWWCTRAGCGLRGMLVCWARHEEVLLGRSVAEG